jgi:uncharacterized lipoprotein
MILGYDFIEERLFAAIQKVGKTVTDPATKAALKKVKKATNTGSFQQPPGFRERLKKAPVLDLGICSDSKEILSSDAYLSEIRKQLRK